MNHMIAGVLSIPLLALVTTGVALADGRGGLIGWMLGEDKSAPVVNETYRTECGGCHAPFPAWMMPADAWRRILGSLKKHFGDDVNLEPAEAKEVIAYLTANAAKGDSTVVRVAPAKPGAPPGLPRVTETNHFRERHAEISLNSVKSNPKIGSFANCQACHPHADLGGYREEDVYIPRSGR